MILFIGTRFSNLYMMMMPFICSYRNKNEPTVIYQSFGYYRSTYVSLGRLCTLRKVRTIRVCLGGLALMIWKVGWSRPLLSHSSHHPIFPSPRRPFPVLLRPNSIPEWKEESSPPNRTSTNVDNIRQCVGRIGHCDRCLLSTVTGVYSAVSLTGHGVSGVCYCSSFDKACVCLLLQYLWLSCSRGGRGKVEDMCQETRFCFWKNNKRSSSSDDEQRPVWTRLPITH